MPSLGVYPYLFLCFLISLADAQTCYYPNGDSSTDTPCNSTAQFSACCAAADFCLSNHLCFSSTNQLLWRGSCTDQNWNALECPRYCRNNDTNTGGPMYPCPNGAGFCCGSESCCTSGTPIIIANAPSVILRGTQLTTYMTTATVTDLSSSTSSPLSSTPAVNSQASNNKNLAIGLGVGVPLGVALISAIIVLFRELRRHNNIKEKQLNNATTSAPALMEEYHQPELIMPPRVHELSGMNNAPPVHELAQHPASQA